MNSFMKASYRWSRQCCCAVLGLQLLLKPLLALLHKTSPVELLLFRCPGHQQGRLLLQQLFKLMLRHACSQSHVIGHGPPHDTGEIRSTQRLQCSTHQPGSAMELHQTGQCLAAPLHNTEAETSLGQMQRSRLQLLQRPGHSQSRAMS